MSYFLENKEAMEKLCELDHFIADGITHYVTNGVPMGGFLTAVFSNDLFKAIAKADDNCQADLVNIVRFIYWYCPSMCHGSPEIVNDWIALKRNKGEE